ncbi:MAG: hypothetical protein OXJ37_00530 [Bryobacterales bacterium]|nr:hypothetical protein [Bryobacterales bacterium]
MQTGWALREFHLDMAAPSERALDDGTVEIPLGFKVKQREVQMALDWIPPDDLAASH